MKNFIVSILSIIVVVSFLSIGRVIFIEVSDVNADSLRMLFSLLVVGSIGLAGTLLDD